MKTWEGHASEGVSLSGLWGRSRHRKACLPGRVAPGGMTQVDPAVTVRVRNGQVGTTEGQNPRRGAVLAGFFILQARDLNDAIRMAAADAAAGVESIEVHPVTTSGITVRGRPGCRERTQPAHGTPAAPAPLLGGLVL